MDELKNLSFATAEYLTRVAQVQRGMTERGLDGLLCHSMGDICYLTGFESLYQPKYYMVLVPRRGDPVLFAQDFEMSNALISAWTPDRVAYALGDDPVEATIHLLVDRGLDRARLGIDGNSPSLTARTYLRLKEGLSQVEWIDAGGMVREVRLIKSPAEIDYLRWAAKVADGAMSAALNAAGEGKSDNDVAAAACRTALEAGSEYMCLEPIVTVGRRSGIPHTTHRRTVIRKGDTVFVELGACIHRYSGVIMRTAVIGPPTDKIRRMADACIRSVETMIREIKPGRAASEVAGKARSALGPAGRDFLWHGYYGYSIGLGFPPDWADGDWCIREDNDRPLQPGMVFHCNTSLRDIGWVGVAFSETVVVTPSGCEVLTGLPRELVIR